MLSLSRFTQVSYYHDLNSNDYYIKEDEPLGQFCELEENDEEEEN